MATLTTTYSFSMPLVGGDADVWGGMLNANWDDLDDRLTATFDTPGAGHLGIIKAAKLPLNLGSNKSAGGGTSPQFTIENTTTGAAGVAYEAEGVTVYAGMRSSAFRIGTGDALNFDLWFDLTTNGLTLTSASAGNAVGPSLDLFRNSASPEDGDTLGEFKFTGKNSSGTTVEYGRLVAQIEDQTNGTEDGKLLFQLIKAGARTTIANMTVSGFMVGIDHLIDPTVNEFGFSMALDGIFTAARQDDICARFKRSNTGSVVQFYRTADVAGVISVAAGPTTSYGTTSDARLKQDLKSFSSGALIDALEVWDFEWIKTGERAHGVIAQAAKNIYPEAINYDDKSDTYMADYSKFVPLLLQEVKDLRNRVAELENQHG